MRLAFALVLFVNTLFVPVASSAADVPFKPLESVRASGPHLTDRGGLTLLGVGSVLVAGARDQDEEMQTHFRGQNRLGDFDEAGNYFFGTGVPGVLIGGGLWYFGDKYDDARTIHAGHASLEAVATTAITVSTLKLFVNRERPDGSDRFSFPSGHTSTVFASAGVLHQFYGWKTGAVAEAIGVLTGLGRVEANRHWFSDTVGGGLIGFAIGRAVARAHLNELGELESADEKRQASFTVVPFVDRDFALVQVTTLF
jgi:hypothetical protein